MSVKKIKKFLIEVQQATDKSSLILYHLNISQRKYSIWSEPPTWTTPDETAPSIFEAAKQHAEQMGGPQKFMISAYDKADPEESKEHPIRSAMFTITPANASDADTVGGEPPTGEGMLAQFMRHNQEMHRLMTQMTGSVTHYMAKTIDRQGDTIEKMMGDRQNQLLIMEELMSKKSEREIASMQTVASIERKKELFEKIMQLGPMILNKVTGQEIIRQKHSTLESSVMAFMETVTPQKLDQIVSSGLFDQRQMLLFSTVLEQMTKTMMTTSEKSDMMKDAERAVTNEPSPPAGP